MLITNDRRQTLRPYLYKELKNPLDCFGRHKVQWVLKKLLMTKLGFVGNYTKDGGRYYSEESKTKLIVGHRKDTTTKTKDFILFVTGDRTRPQFFSSLFPTTTENIFKADYQGINYEVELSGGNLTISER
jgi:hypothetical protein